MKSRLSFDHEATINLWYLKPEIMTLKVLKLKLKVRLIRERDSENRIFVKIGRDVGIRSSKESGTFDETLS